MIIDADIESLDVTGDWLRAPLELVRQLAEFPSALIGDAQARMNVMGSGISCLTPLSPLSGTVLPVTTREGDNLAIHKALDLAQPGDVLVVNAGGDVNRACFGGILAEICVEAKVAGVVIDGAVRDVEELVTLGFSTFARGVSPAGPSKVGPGVVGRPVACGSVVCEAGDVVIGDRDGVVVVPRGRLDEVLKLTQRQVLVEEALRARIALRSVSTR